MKILIAGGGGREHVIASRLNSNSKVSRIFCSPGNGGTEMLSKCTNIPFEDLEQLSEFALKNSIDLTIPGPEQLLCDGIVDLFKAKGLKIFGPDKESARLEGSKAFAKDFMKKYGVKTADYKRYNDPEEALKSLSSWNYPLVVKADGLAAGKGVLICENKAEAEEAVKKVMVDKHFGGAGSEVVIEDFLEGIEASILSFFDGEKIVPMMSAKDHKRIGEGDTGLNTGGMGVISPNPWVTDEVMKSFKNDILNPTFEGLKQENLLFPGIIFFGLMINSSGVYLLEYNLRFGDPEIQTIMPMMENDFLEVIDAAVSGNLKDIDFKWYSGYSCCVVLASGGYPEKYEKYYPVTGYENVDSNVFFAGVEKKGDKLITSGGRVLAVTARGETLEEARNRAYTDAGRISFKNSYMRKDIGK